MLYYHRIKPHCRDFRFWVRVYRAFRSPGRNSFAHHTRAKLKKRLRDKLNQQK